jgi:hypothetical protein
MSLSDNASQYRGNCTELSIFIIHNLGLKLEGLRNILFHEHMGRSENGDDCAQFLGNGQFCMR